MKALILYDSITGNTEKVAERINLVLKAKNLHSTILKLGPDIKLNFYAYDLIFLGSPSIEWLPTPKMINFIKTKIKDHRLNGDVLPSAPLRPGKFAIPFATFCGTHIGKEEVVSVTQWLAAFLGHIGFQIVNSIHIVGEMKSLGQTPGWKSDEELELLNTQGRLGNIKGRPNEQDLLDLEKQIKGILAQLNFMVQK